MCTVQKGLIRLAYKILFLWSQQVSSFSLHASVLEISDFSTQCERKCRPSYDIHFIAVPSLQRVCPQLSGLERYNCLCCLCNAPIAKTYDHDDFTEILFLKSMKRAFYIISSVMECMPRLSLTLLYQNQMCRSANRLKVMGPIFQNLVLYFI